MSQKILVVDDESNIIELISYNLKQNGYEPIIAVNGSEAWEQFLSSQPDLVLLDIMMPGLDGMELCRRIRKKSMIPVIMVSAKTEEFDKVIALELGADDYVTKPFSVRELMARVRALLRRSTTEEFPENDTVEEVIRTGELEMYPQKHQVLKEGKDLLLTLTEYRILEKLMNNPGRVYSRELLMESIMGTDFPGDTRTIDVHIRHLRKKIEDNSGSPRYLLTVRGVGYKFSDGN